MISPRETTLLWSVIHGIAEGAIFADSMLECPEEAGCVFLPLVLMHESSLEKLMEGGLGMVWEYRSKAVRHEAGMPVFLSANYLNPLDAAEVLGAVERLRSEVGFSFEQFSRDLTTNRTAK